MKFFSVLLVSLALIGCAQIPMFIDTDDLESYESDIKFVLPDDVIYEEKKGIVHWFYGVKEGVYSAKYQDRRGYYFVSDGLSSCIGTKGKSGGCTSFMQGGLWVSKANPNDIRMFYLGDTEEDAKEVNMGWIYYLTIDSLTVQTPNEEFAARISKLKVADGD